MTQIYHTGFVLQYESINPERAAQTHHVISLIINEMLKDHPHIVLVKHEQTFISEWTSDEADNDTENSHHHEQRSLDDQYINNQ